MNGHSVYCQLPYTRQLVRLAVCDVLEQEGCLDFVRDEPGGAILADVTVYGNPGRFAIAVRDGLAGTELSVSITEPKPGLSPEGQRRAETYLAQRVLQMVESTIGTHPLRQRGEEKETGEKRADKGGLLAFLGGRARVRESGKRAEGPEPAKGAREGPK